MSAMDISQSPTGTAQEKKNGPSRRVWSEREEEALLICLKELASKGFKSDNGFRPGYLPFLEKSMRKVFPGTDLKGSPHITSKIHVWKKQHGSIITMLSRSGFGWNETERRINVSEEVWVEYVRTDSAAKGMRSKSWPFYYDWCEIFGRDRATGEHVEAFGQVTDEIAQEGNNNNENPVPVESEKMKSMHDANDYDVVSDGGASSTKKGSRKRKKVDVPQLTALLAVVTTFTEKTETRLGEIAQRIGFEFDLSKRRNAVFNALTEIPGLDMRDRIKVATHLVRSKEELDLFFSIEGIPRVEYAHMLKEKYKNSDL